MTTESLSSGVPALPSTDDLDRQLTLAFQAGDKDAYREIHDRYAAKVERLCRRMLGNPEDAQEAAQETFLRTYQALGRFNGRYRVGAWITRIATNVCLDHLRARARWRWEAVPAEVMELDPHSLDESANPEIIHIRRAEGRRIRRLLSSLSPMHRAAIVLRDFEGLSYEEIGAALEMTEGQVKALLHRARKSFKRSWNYGRLATLLPLPWLRRMEDGARDPVDPGMSATQGADIATSVSNFVAACPSLHQCGQMLSERAAAVVTTVALSTAAVTGVAATLPASSGDELHATNVVGTTPPGVTAGEDASIQALISSEDAATSSDVSTGDEDAADDAATEEPEPESATEAPAQAESPSSEPPPSESPPSEPPPGEPPPSEPPATDPAASEPPPSELPPSEEPPASQEAPPAYDEPAPPADEMAAATDGTSAEDDGAEPSSEETSSPEPPSSEI
jgi:RNA polymerase sigma-70 factor (ECF subfamily)